VPLVAWILAGALAATVVLAFVFALAYRRARARAAQVDELVSAARRAVRAAAEEETATQLEQLRIAISRSHADSFSAYATEERRLSDERRGELTVKERELSERLAETLAGVERRVEERLHAWESDLERAQRALEREVAALEHHQGQRIAEVEARIDAEAGELGMTIERQRAAAISLREELEQTAKEALTEALEELQSQAADRRRAIEDIAERLRQREHALNEQVDNAESEARARLEIASAELERRQIEHLDRALAREVDRLAEAGGLEFENRMRAIREEAADRLQSELDRMSEAFLRRADALIASQFQHAADTATQRLGERIAESARRWEAARTPGPG
jgi:gas vesicle protein